MSKILLTSYIDPDLDGTACMFAYEEFLQKKGIEIKAGIFGRPHREAEFVFDTFAIPRLASGKLLLPECDQIILVDASRIKDVSEKIDPAKVIEVIDHRAVNDAEKFIKAQIQIEKVGAAATLIAEKYFTDRVPLSRFSAIMLYLAIVSNTINFQNSLTTDRDKKAADWLFDKAKLPDDFVKDMFMAGESGDPGTSANKTIL